MQTTSADRDDRIVELKCEERERESVCVCVSESEWAREREWERAAKKIEHAFAVLALLSTTAAAAGWRNHSSEEKCKRRSWLRTIAGSLQDPLCR